MDDGEDTNRPPKPSYPEGPDGLEETEDQEPETDESDKQVDTTEESQGSGDTEGPKQDLIYLKSEADGVMFRRVRHKDLMYLKSEDDVGFQTWGCYKCYKVEGKCRYQKEPVCSLCERLGFLKVKMSNELNL